MENERKKFHITITDNETGEVEVDTDAAAIIGAYDAGTRGTASISYTECNGIVLSCTLAGVMHLLAGYEEREPIEYRLAEMLLKKSKSRNRKRITKKEIEKHE